MNLMQFQLWLNVRGAGIVADGKAGPQTRKAIIDMFRNTQAQKATIADKQAVAALLGGSLKQLQAVDLVESGGSGWDKNGQLKCLFERHYVWRRIKAVIPLLSNPTPGGYTIDADNDGINDSWEKIADMAMRNPIVAFESASFGKFQIMGAHANQLGHINAIDFAYALSRNEAAHYNALGAFIRVNGLVNAFRKLSTNPEDNKEFARGYNGKSYAKGGYHIRLAKAML